MLRAGFTLVEGVLAVAIGLVVLGATIVTYHSVHNSANLSNARSMVGTIQTNIAMDKFRLGSAPPITPVPSASNQTAVSTNQDSIGKPLFPGTNVGALPPDPVFGLTTVQSFNSQATAAALVPGDPSDQWDNPIFSQTGGNPPYGKGGWLYDPATGSFRINLNNHDYPGDRPGAW